MAKRPAPPQPQSANLNLEQIRRAVPRLEKRIADLEAFNPSTLATRNAPDVGVLQVSIESTLAEVFGHDTVEYRRYLPAARLYAGPVTMTTSWVTARRGGMVGQDLQFRHYLEDAKQRSIALLKQAVSALQERAAELERDAETPAVSAEIPVEFARKAFIVHGHDEASREAVARFLERIGIEPVILHELPNKGRTLIAKFNEEAADVSFAVVLLTSDDFGGKAGDDLRPRARQNVIFELGFFIGALGPQRVAPLVAAGVELPSDYDGVVYIPLDSDWRTQLAKELDAAGYSIDWNKAMRR